MTCVNEWMLWMRKWMQMNECKLWMNANYEWMQMNECDKWMQWMNECNECVNEWK